MKLRGIEFGKVLGASGVQGFFGEGYWFHRLWRPFGLDFTGMTFVAKTATLLPRPGNMPLTRDYTPKHFFPDCVKANFSRGIMLNAVGLSNPGLGALLRTGLWQARTEPFMLSIMSLADTPEKRLQELCLMTDILGFHKDEFRAPFALQINLSCPNTGHNLKERIQETAASLEIASKLGVPLMPKFSIASASPLDIMELNQNPHCDAICVSNSLPFDWAGVGPRAWGADASPLAKLGGGGLSGKVLLPMVCDWIKMLRDAGFTKPINGGGGILCRWGVGCYFHAGANSVFLGSVAALRPWRVRCIIKRANELEWRRS
jgi:dihydroorotate dehydrogenase